MCHELKQLVMWPDRIALKQAYLNALGENF